MFYQSDLDDLENLRAYKYQSEDHSLLAKFLLRHYWNWVIKFVPSSVAPNLLTAIGGLSMVCSAALTMSLDPLLCSSKTKLLYLANAILLFLYSTMDSIDGKQAIRTSSVSPLGQLMDHGVDSLVTTLAVLACGSSIGVGIRMELMFLLFLVYLPFYYGTLYENLTSKMVFGYINGATEGIMACFCIHMTAFFFGPDTFSFLHKINILEKLGLRITNLLLFEIIFYIVYNVYFVLDILWETGLKHLNLVLTGFLVINGLFLSSALIANTSAFKSHVFAYLTISTIALLFSYISVDLILASIKNSDPPSPPDPYFLFLFSSIFCFHDSSNFILESYITCLLVAMAVFYFIRVYSIFSLISQFLGIEIFKIKH